MKLTINCLIVAALVGLLAPAGNASVLLDGYAATVGTSIITVGEVKEHMQRRNRKVFAAMQAGEQFADAELAELYESALDELIAEALIVAEYERLEDDGKVAIPEDAVDNTIQSIVRERYNNNRSEFFSDLKRANTTFNEFKEQQRRNIILMVMRNNQFSGPVSVSPGAARRLYEERIDDYRVPAKCELSLIIVNLAEAEDERNAQFDKARGMLAAIAGGQDFAEVARAGSDGSRAEEGGYRAWMELKDLRSELRAALEDMSPGECSALIEAGSNLYILRLHDRRSASVRPFDDVKDELTAELRSIETDRRTADWIKQLREKHYVNKYPLPKGL